VGGSVNGSRRSHDDAQHQLQHPCNLQFVEVQRRVHLMADATSGPIQSGRIFLPTERTTGLEPRGRDSCLGLPGVGGAVPGGMADSDLEARDQRLADRRLYLGNAPVPAWGPFLLDRRPRTKTFAGFASGRLTLPKHAGGPGSKQPGPSRLSAKGAFRPFTAWPGFLHYALHLGLRFAGNRGRPKRTGQMREPRAT
jgi:hypothetical protein